MSLSADTPVGLVVELVDELRARANPDNVAGMARYGISPVGTLGATMPDVRALARDAKRALGRGREAWHELALLLWDTGVHEARIMAAVIEVPALTTRDQIDRWVLDIDSWDTCDQLCGNVLWETSFAWELPAAYSERPEPFVKRVGFVVATQLAVKDKGAADALFLPFLDLVAREAVDERNDVKKGVNWALRQIGKRSAALNAAAIETAERILAEQPGSTSARWIARDALRELRSEAVRTRLGIETG